MDEKIGMKFDAQCSIIQHKDCFTLSNTTMVRIKLKYNSDIQDND